MGRKLRIAIAEANFSDLPSTSRGPRAADLVGYKLVSEAGFEAVQGGARSLAEQCGLSLLGFSVAATSDEILDEAAKWRDEGAIFTSLIAGYGYESDAELDALVSAVLDATQKYALPIFLETHRGSITQDAWRTVQLVKRFPEIMFTGDFSHWYTGQEMAYGSFEDRLCFLQPVFERVAVLHGRVGDRGSIQVDFSAKQTAQALGHMKKIWQECMAHARERADKQDLWFVSELLGPQYGYARQTTTSGALEEETDRWEQALALAEYARAAFAAS